jgi:hypothetical protein
MQSRKIYRKAERFKTDQITKIIYF